MIAGDFRFIWKQLTRHFDVTDGLPKAMTSRYHKKLKLDEQPLTHFSTKRAVPAKRLSLR